MLQSSAVVATVAWTGPRSLVQIPFHQLIPSKVLLTLLLASLPATLSDYFYYYYQIPPRMEKLLTVLLNAENPDVYTVNLEGL